jgi:hypothetical protein
MLAAILKFSVGAVILGFLAVGTLMVPGVVLGPDSAAFEEDAATSNNDSWSDANGLQMLHQKYVDQFANTQDFGMERMPIVHHFSNLPETWTAQEDGSRWQVKRYHLVGILKADPPVVYLTNGPIRMFNSQDPNNKRALDSFERSRLPNLRAGEDLAVDRSDSNRIRMLGAIRAAKNCAECHQVLEGSLLGAFSYELQRLTPGS